jgi:hypothetical protein
MKLSIDAGNFWRCCGEYAALVRLNLIYSVATDEKFVGRIFGIQHNTVKGRLRLIASLASDAELVVE